MNNEEIIKCIEDNKLSDAWERLKPQLAQKSDIDLYLLAGKIKMKQQIYGEALNYFYEVIRMESTNKEALSLISTIKSILNISNSFYYENTYLDDTLYE